jgi:molybdopterin converting factor small subunit
VKVTVLLFARYAELAGRSRVEVEVADRATLAEVWERVAEAHPALRAERAPLLACDRAYAAPDRVVEGREEIAAFPPVSGG